MQVLCIVVKVTSPRFRSRHEWICKDIYIYIFSLRYLDESVHDYIFILIKSFIKTQGACIGHPIFKYEYIRIHIKSNNWLGPLREHLCQVWSRLIPAAILQKKLKMCQPIRGQGCHIGFRIYIKVTTLARDPIRNRRSHLK